MQLYQRMASVVDARLRCIERGNVQWITRHGEVIEKLCEELPTGSGFDSGAQIDLEKSTGERLVFYTSFHHMDEVGGYDGWTDHSVIVTPSLILGISIRVTGKDRNDIKDYIGEAFEQDLTKEID